MVLDGLYSVCCCLTWKTKGEGVEGPQTLHSNGESSARGGWSKGRMTRSEQASGRKVPATELLFQEGLKGTREELVSDSGYRRRRKSPL